MSSSCQVFVSPSSKDDKLIDLITLIFKGREIAPYFARRMIEGKNPVDKIIEAIDNSIGVFALMTYNVVTDTNTRDWVVFEIALAKARDKPIYCWMENVVATNKLFPKLLENITDYDKFDYEKDEECYRVVTSILEKALELMGTHGEVKEPTRKELEEGLIKLDEAKKIAIEFVSNEKKPTSVTISSIEPKGDKWIVKGTATTRFKGGSSSEKWTVEIAGKEVLSYKFEPGGFFAVI